MRGLAWRMVTSSIRVRPEKWALMVGSLVLGVSVAAAMASLAVAIRSQMNRELRAYGPNLLVAPRAAGAAEAATLDEGIGADLMRTEEGAIRSAAPLLYGVAVVGGQEAIIAGTRVKPLLELYPAWEIASSGPLNSLDPSSCLVGRKLAERLGVKAGSRVVISVGASRRDFQVAGVLTTGDVEESQVFMGLEDFQVLSARSGKISVLALSVLGRFDEVVRLAERLEKRFPSAETRVVRKVAVAEGSLLGKLELMMGLSAAVLLLIAGLSVGTTFSGIVAERRKEVAVFLALGRSESWVTRLFLGEAAVLGATGGVFGCAAGIAMSQVLGKVLFGVLIPPQWPVAAGAVLLGVVTSIAAFAIPVRRVLALEPAAILKGE